MFGHVPSREDNPGSSGRNESSGRLQIQKVNQIDVGKPLSPVLPGGDDRGKEKFYSTDEDQAVIPDDKDHLNRSKVYKGPRSHESADIQKFNSMRLKAKRHIFHQNIHPHINVSDIILNSQEFDDNVEKEEEEKRISDYNKASTANGDFEKKLSTFTQMTHSMPLSGKSGP